MAKQTHSSVSAFRSGPRGQVSAWQSATLLPISCKSVRPVSARVENPVSPVRQSSYGSSKNNLTLSQVALSQHGKVGCQNWHTPASAYFVLPQAENTIANTRDVSFGCFYSFGIPSKPGLLSNSLTCYVMPSPTWCRVLQIPCIF